MSDTLDWNAKTIAEVSAPNEGAGLGGNFDGRPGGPGASPRPPKRRAGVRHPGDVPPRTDTEPDNHLRLRNQGLEHPPTPTGTTTLKRRPLTAVVDNAVNRDIQG